MHKKEECTPIAYKSGQNSIKISNRWNCRIEALTGNQSVEEPAGVKKRPVPEGNSRNQRKASVGGKHPESNKDWRSEGKAGVNGRFNGRKATGIDGR